MNTEEQFSSSPSWEGTLYPEWAHRIVRLEGALKFAGAFLVVVRFGFGDTIDATFWQWMAGYLIAMLGSIAGFAVRYAWSRRRGSFNKEQWHLPAFFLIWIVGGLLTIFTGDWFGQSEKGGVPWPAVMTWTEGVILIQGIVAFVVLVKSISARGYNPTLILVLSFVLLITIGTLLLMMPRARVQSPENPGIERAPLLTALYTSTSASCVTGLVVVHTGDYWSRFGQVVILGLFQIGGLGIMTFGAIFAIAAGRKLEIREAATFQNLLDSEHMNDVPRIIGAIAAVTFGTELVGAAILSTLWPDSPWGERCFLGLFHSVSAFCNAGFTLTPNSLVDMADRWQVWGVMSGLIIIGGLGFIVNYNILLVIWSKIGEIRSNPLFDLPRNRLRLSLSSKMVLSVSASLLAIGMLAVYVLDAASPASARSLGDGFNERVANAWFQSVTCRTAGFNTVDIGGLNPAAKLFSIILMFIGASPGSTGGGVKTTCFLLTVLALMSLLRGRERVEYRGRTIPTEQVNRALTIVALSLGLVFFMTLFVSIFEDQETQFLDHLFEVTSAFGTVGLSTGISAELTVPSKIIIILTMFIGRVGPLTLLVAMAGQAASPRYEYPEERISLG